MKSKMQLLETFEEKITPAVTFDYTVLKIRGVNIVTSVISVMIEPTSWIYLCFPPNVCCLRVLIWLC